MSDVAPRINYAKNAGFESLPAAIVFAILYAPLFVVFVKKSFSRPTYVHYVMTFFCIVRLTAFIIQAVLAGSDTAGHHLGVLIADEILFGVGYAGLLYSSYTLILNLEDISKRTLSSDRIENPLIGLTKNRGLFRLAVVAAVTLGIVASTSVNDDGTPGSSSTALREASTIIFLVLTLLLVFQTIYLSRFRLRESRLAYNEHDTFGTKHGYFILMTVSLLLLVRVAFITATMTPSTHSKQFNEHFWYPLVAVPEILAVLLYTTPGLVPAKDELEREPEKDEERTDFA